MKRVIEGKSAAKKKKGLIRKESDSKCSQQPSGFTSDDQLFEELFSPSRLRKTWNQVRRELKDLDLRDAVDWIDWATLIEKTLHRIREEILDGRYQPLPPARYELGKSKGSFRYMTIPNLRDRLIYRHISDAALERAAPYSIKGAFFSRRHAVTPVGKTHEQSRDPYDRFFQVWFRYNEYRTRTLLSAPYEILVTSDITNYFDSIEHDLLLEYLAPLDLPRKAVALLGRLLEMLKPTAGHSPNPRVGLPVDELDCSRQLAHIFLFEHDMNVLQALGANAEERYVRWMDDQNIGAKSLTDARRIVNHLTRSLQKQRLTLNAGKTKFLTPEEVMVEFHLDANTYLTKWDERWSRKKYLPKKSSRAELRAIWQQASKHRREGHWDKLLKRFYACATVADTKLLEGFAYDHLVNYPSIAPRIFAYYARRGRGVALIELFEKYVKDDESLFEATEAAFFDALLLGDFSARDEKMALDLVTRYLDGSLAASSGGDIGKASAILAYYWLGGDIKCLATKLEKKGWSKLSTQVARAFLAALAATSSREFAKTAIKFVGHPSDDVARITEFIQAIHLGEILTLKFPFAHLKRKWPLRGKHYDTRAWLQLELLSFSIDKGSMIWLKNEVAKFKKYAVTRQELRVLARLKKTIKKNSKTVERSRK
jgi:hypothetical protein